MQDLEEVPESEVMLTAEVYPYSEILAVPVKDIPMLSNLNQACVNGLINVGNSCYFNVVLQCLANTPGIKEYFLSNLHLKEFNLNGRISPADSLTSRIGEFIQLYHSYNDYVMNPFKLIEMVIEQSKIFDPTKIQEDAHEFLLYMLDRIATDLNR